ncbi:MAG: hypothetical protein H6Q91_1293 [Deltaproteobacteria bacterium]|nr:hypothetical protein [Deltaproteobacteria bacterium]
MTRTLRLLVAVTACGVLGASAPAGADLAKWDQTKVADLAKQLADATQALNDTFYKQPPPGAGSMQSRAYQQLRQKIRAIRMEAGSLSSSLAKGEGYEETLPSYESLMEMVRAARRDAQQVFSTADVQQKATAVRVVLNQLSPYYDPDAVPLAAATR